MTARRAADNKLELNTGKRLTHRAAGLSAD